MGCRSRSRKEVRSRRSSRGLRPRFARPRSPRSLFPWHFLYLRAVWNLLGAIHSGNGARTIPWLGNGSIVRPKRRCLNIPRTIYQFADRQPRVSTHNRSYRRNRLGRLRHLLGASRLPSREHPGGTRPTPRAQGPRRIRTKSKLTPPRVEPPVVLRAAVDPTRAAIRHGRAPSHLRTGQKVPTHPPAASPPTSCF